MTPVEHRRAAIQRAAGVLRRLDRWDLDETDHERLATAAYDAIAPDLRRAFAEEAAQAIEARRITTPNQLLDLRRVNGINDGLTDAADAVRETGGIA